MSAGDTAIGRLQSVWFGDEPPGFGLRALSGVYAAITSLRRFAYDRGLLRREQLWVPVIVVGNLTLGGAGKTPVVIALAEALAARGFAPGVVSRGYGRRERGLRVVTPASTADEVGDEPLLIHLRSRCPVAVAAHRADAARELIERHGCDVIIADDGLQHYRLDRDIELLVIDGRRRFGNGRLLPAGPLREPRARAERCDWRLVPGGEPQTGEIAVPMSVSVAVPLAGPGEGEARPLADLRGHPVHAVAGIGDPDRYFATLQVAGLELRMHRFADHHRYRREDLNFADDAPVLMTEKDAVKCREFAQPHWHSVPLKTELPHDLVAALVDRLLAHPGGRG